MRDGGRARRIKLVDAADDAGFAPVFGTQTVRPPVAGPPKRWGRVVAPLALVAIVAVAGAVSSLSDDQAADRAAPPTTAAPAPATTTRATAPTSTPTATTPGTSGQPGGAPSTVAPPDVAIRLVADPPPGFVLQFTSTSTDAELAGGTPADDQLAEIWSSAVDASPGNRWMDVRASTTSPFLGASGSVRIETPLGPVLVSTDALTGTMFLSGEGRDGAVDITSKGLSVGEATAVFAATTRPDRTIAIEAGAIPADLQLLVGPARWSDLEWRARTSLYYANAGATSSLAVEVGAPLTPLQHQLDWFRSTRATSADVGGERALVATSRWGSTAGRAVSFDHLGNHVVVSAQGLSDDELLTFARALHVAGDDEWAGVEAAARAVESTTFQPPTPAPGANPLASGVTSDGGTWTVSLDAATTLAGARLDLLTVTTGMSSTVVAMSSSEPVTSQPNITSMATDRVTLVTAIADASAAGATLRVVVGDAAVDAPLVAVPGTALLVAVAPFELAGPFTAEVVAPDGTVSTTYDPLAASNPQERSSP